MEFKKGSYYRIYTIPKHWNSWNKERIVIGHIVKYLGAYYENGDEYDGCMFSVPGICDATSVAERPEEFLEEDLNGRRCPKSKELK